MKKLFLTIILCTNYNTYCMHNLHTHVDTDNNKELFYALKTNSSDQTKAHIKNLLSRGADIIPLMSSNNEAYYMYLPDHKSFLTTQHFHVFSFRSSYPPRTPFHLLHNKSLLMDLLEKSKQEEYPNAPKLLYKALGAIHDIFEAVIDEPLLPQDHTVKHISTSLAYNKYLLFLYRARKQDVEDFFGKKNIDYAQSLLKMHDLQANL